jgi:hypothetical protein
MIRTTVLALALVVSIACEPPEGPNTTGAKVPAPGAVTEGKALAASSSGGRAIGAEGRAAMKEQLGGETTGKKAWILSQPGNPEVATLVGNLVGVFKEAGWEVQTDTASGISLKPGLMTLVAEEQYPSYVDTVLKALDASGLDAKSAAGYRSYYESKKKENPSWPGVPMRADQDFVIVIGPKAPS